MCYSIIHSSWDVISNLVGWEEKQIKSVGEKLFTLLEPVSHDTWPAIIRDPIKQCQWERQNPQENHRWRTRVPHFSDSETIPNERMAIPTEWEIWNFEYHSSEHRKYGCLGSQCSHCCGRRTSSCTLNMDSMNWIRGQRRAPAREIKCGEIRKLADVEREIDGAELYLGKMTPEWSTKVPD